ncbi:hypothetical protein PISMIDRAFT_453166 [Pisolithus microcarpus 441]|uniref:Uncharacterized protein n=1 Tax=Pisolithus microcarpus 441 TaxID=765257 RepID=A0A0C9Y5T7_9AGAM|nr:hypothetical protein PISMIDRAFT_453166 [Pisolithus microcarpus 441]
MLVSGCDNNPVFPLQSQCLSSSSSLVVSCTHLRGPSSYPTSTMTRLPTTADRQSRRDRVVAIPTFRPSKELCRVHSRVTITQSTADVSQATNCHVTIDYYVRSISHSLLDASFLSLQNLLCYFHPDDLRESLCRICCPQTRFLPHYFQIFL